MSSLDNDLNKKFGKQSRLRDDEKKSKKTYWDAAADNPKYRRSIDENGRILEHTAANADTVSESQGAYSAENSEGTQNVFDDLVEKLRGLSRSEKEVIQLLWEGKSESDVADILNISKGTVSTYLERARKKIKKMSVEKGF